MDTDTVGTRWSNLARSVMPWIVTPGIALEAVDQPGDELALVGRDRGHPGHQFAPAFARVRGTRRPATSP